MVQGNTYLTQASKDTGIQAYSDLVGMVGWIQGTVLDNMRNERIQSFATTLHTSHLINVEEGIYTAVTAIHLKEGQEPHISELDLFSSLESIT